MCVYSSARRSLSNEQRGRLQIEFLSLIWCLYAAPLVLSAGTLAFSSLNTMPTHTHPNQTIAANRKSINNLMLKNTAQYSYTFYKKNSCLCFAMISAFSFFVVLVLVHFVASFWFRFSDSRSCFWCCVNAIGGLLEFSLEYISFGAAAAICCNSFGSVVSLAVVAIAFVCCRLFPR